MCLLMRLWRKRRHGTQVLQSPSLLQLAQQQQQHEQQQGKQQQQQQQPPTLPLPLPPPPQQQQKQLQQHAAHSDEEEVVPRLRLEHGAPMFVRKRPTAPWIAGSIKCSSDGGYGGRRSGSGGSRQRRVLGMPLLPVVAVSAAGLPVLMSHVIR
jgi:glucose/arabinose dehydrogenase